MTQDEHQEQCALMQWWAWECRYYDVDERLLYAIPNGGLRSRITGARMKREGARAGVPDLFLAVAKRGYYGMYIEMKTETGRVQPSQEEMMSLLQAQGYMCVVCRGWEEARRNIVAYLEGA